MKKPEPDFLDYMSTIISSLRASERMGTAHVYQSTLNRIKDFIKGTSLSFADITPQWLISFQEHLLRSLLHWNTISTYMRAMRAVYNRAVDAGMAPYRPRLFKGVFTGTKVRVKRALDEQSICRMGQPVEGEVEAGVDTARQMFLLLFVLRGIPFVDIAYMRRCDLQGSLLTYRRRKTGAWLTVRVEPEAMQLIERLKNPDADSPYLFPFISGTGAEAYRQYTNALRRFNYQLKRLEKLMGGGVRLSTYAARHSWATIANFCNFQPELICNAMGHSSVKVTETYFKRYADERIHEMNRSILSTVFRR